MTPDTATTRTPRAWLAAGAGIIVLLRIPAFLEPHWYSDESTYAYVGRTVFDGGVLYRSPGAWDNKPPVQYWIYGIVTHFLGYSEAALHLVPFVSAVAAVLAVGWGVARLTGSQLRAGIACVLAALVIGPPVFDSQLFLPEGALIGPMTWAGMLMLVHIASPGWATKHRWAPYVAGFLASIALGMQQTVIADIAAICIIALIAGNRRWRALLPFLGTGLVVSLLWFLPTLIASGWNATIFATIGFYQIYAHNALPTTLLSRVLHFAGIAGGVVAIIVGGALLARRTRNAFWMLWVLGGIDLLVAGSAHFPYPHLLLPSIPWVAAALAATPWQRWSSLAAGLGRPQRAVGAALLAAGLILALVEGSYAGSYWINGRSLKDYYSNGYASLVNASERSWWQSSFDSHVVPDIAVTDWLQSHHYAGSSAVLWNVSDEWVYLTTPLYTTLPTVGLFNDDVMLAGRSAIGPYVARHRPRIIVTDAVSVAQRPSILPVLAQYYLAVYRVGPYVVYVERPSSAAVTSKAATPAVGDPRSAV
jgi:4-amino-4-deoxy-L-arabinose transferase-like glycosyltransferase